LKLIKDEYIMRLIERISGHYCANISNSFIRPALKQAEIDKSTWDQLELLTEKFELFRYQGYHLDELYRHVAAAARFVNTVRRDIAPSLRYRLSRNTQNGTDNVLWNMAINNFNSNLLIFADLLYDLYVKLAEYDIADSKGKRPLYRQIPELADIGRQLIGT